MARLGDAGWKGSLAEAIATETETEFKLKDFTRVLVSSAGVVSTFQQMWISKGEYVVSGPSIVHRKCFWALHAVQVQLAAECNRFSSAADALTVWSRGHHHRAGDARVPHGVTGWAALAAIGRSSRRLVLRAQRPGLVATTLRRHDGW